MPRKNVLPLAGFPLISWTIRAALGAQSVDEVYVSTEDEEISRISGELEARIIPRPGELAQDDTSSERVIEHAIDYLTNSGIHLSEICLLQPTSPLRNSDHIDAAFDRYLQTNASCIVSVFKPSFNIVKSYKLTEDGSITGLISESAPYTRRQDLPTALLPNGAIYLFSAESFMKERQIPRENVFPFVMSEAESVEIDTESDFIAAERALRIKTDEKA